MLLINFCYLQVSVIWMSSWLLVTALLLYYSTTIIYAFVLTTSARRTSVLKLICARILCDTIIMYWYYNCLVSFSLFIHYTKMTRINGIKKTWSQTIWEWQETDYKIYTAPIFKHTNSATQACCITSLKALQTYSYSACIFASIHDNHFIGSQTKSPSSASFLCLHSFLYELHLLSDTCAVSVYIHTLYTVYESNLWSVMTQ